MAQIMPIVQWCLAHWVDVLHAVSALCGGLIAIFVLIPGDQPEATLQKIVDLIAKISVKPSQPAPQDPPANP